MPKAKLPQYRDGDQTLHPDTCENVLASVKTGEVRMVAVGRGHYPGPRLPRDVMPGLKTIGFFNADREQHWGTGWHYNEGIEVTYLENGHLDFMTEEAVHPLRPNDVTVTRPWQRHCLGDPNVSPSRLYWLMIDLGTRRHDSPWRWPNWIVLRDRDRDELTYRLKHLRNPVLGGGSSFGRCFRRIGEVLARDLQDHSWSLLTVLVNEVLALLLEPLRCQTIPEKDSYQLSLQVVGQFWQNLVKQESLLALPWTLSQLAAQCGLRETQFVQHTQALTNASPMRHLRQCRLQQAARLLVDAPELTITNVAMRCGFSSAQHFATTFRKHFGCPPQTYRITR